MYPSVHLSILLLSFYRFFRSSFLLFYRSFFLSSFLLFYPSFCPSIHLSILLYILHLFPFLLLFLLFILLTIIISIFLSFFLYHSILLFVVLSFFLYLFPFLFNPFVSFFLSFLPFYPYFSPSFCHSFHLSIIRSLHLSVCLWERCLSWVHYVRFRFGTACGYIKRTDLMRAKSLLHIQMYYQENHMIMISVYLCCGFSASYPYLINISFVGIMSKLIIRTVPLHVDLEILRW